jgi:hypothetical protein
MLGIESQWWDLVNMIKKSLGSIKGGEFDKLCKCCLLKTGSTPWG